MNGQLDLIASDEDFDIFMQKAEETLLVMNSDVKDELKVKREDKHEKLSLKSIFKPTGTGGWHSV